MRSVIYWQKVGSAMMNVWTEEVWYVCSAERVCSAFGYCAPLSSQLIKIRDGKMDERKRKVKKLRIWRSFGAFLGVTFGILFGDICVLGVLRYHRHINS